MAGGALDKAFADLDWMMDRARHTGSQKALTRSAYPFWSGSGAMLGVGEQQQTRAGRAAQYYTGWNHATIGLIAKRIAAQPIRIGRLPKGRKPAKDRVKVDKNFLPEHLKEVANRIELVDDNVLSRRLYPRPNSYMTYWHLIVCTIASLRMTGEAYWLLKNENAGPDRPDTRAINFLPTPWVAPQHDGRPFSGWKVTPFNNGEPETYKSEQIVRFFYPDPFDPLKSDSPTKAQAKSISADESIQTAQDRGFKNGLFPDLIFTVGRQAETPGVAQRPRLSMRQREDIVMLVKNMLRGVFKNNEPVILDELIQNVHKLSNTPREMDFMGSSVVTKGRIVQGHNVNPFMLGDMENANRATAVVAENHFCTNVCNTDIEMLSQVITAFVLPLFDPDPELIFYIEPTRANDPEMTIKERDQLVKSASLLRDELRQMYDLPEMEDGVGKTIILMPGQIVLPPSGVQAAAAAGTSAGKPGGDNVPPADDPNLDGQGFDEKPPKKRKPAKVTE